MMATRARYDPAPQLSPAGKTYGVKGDTAKACVQPEVPADRPVTPPEIQKYRQLYWNEPGKRVVHPGTAFDPKPYNEQTSFGIRTTGDGIHAETLIRPNPEPEATRFFRETKEAVYASTKRAPLGQRFTHNHELPAGTQSPDFRFGIVHKSGDHGAKDALFPPDGVADSDPDARALYKRTHHSYEPGEQRSREYKWEATAVRDPTEYRFGYVDKDRESDGVKKCLTTQIDVPEVPATVITKRQHDALRVQANPLGKSRTIGSADPRLPADFVYGKGSALTTNEPEPGAGEIIFGMYTPEQQEPDRDLGRSIKPGLRNFTDAPRVFGLQSIRTDRPAPKIKSIADNSSYAGDPSASSLLRPSKYVTRNIHDEDFLAPRTEAELWTLFEAAGTDASEFAEAFALASNHGAVEKVSVDAVRRAILRLQYSK